MSLLARVDRALVNYIIDNNKGSALPGTGAVPLCVPAKRSEQKELPIIICWSHSCKPCANTPYAGNFEVEAFIEVRTTAIPDTEQAEGENDPRNKADEIVDGVFSLFLAPEGAQSGEALGQLISESITGPPLTIQSCEIVERSQGFNPRAKEQRGNAWVDVLHLEILACGRDVT